MIPRQHQPGEVPALPLARVKPPRTPFPFVVPIPARRSPGKRESMAQHLITPRLDWGVFPPRLVGSMQIHPARCLPFPLAPQWLTPAVFVAVAGLLINQLVNQLGKRIEDLVRQN